MIKIDGSLHGLNFGRRRRCSNSIPPRSHRFQYFMPLSFMGLTLSTSGFPPAGMHQLALIAKLVLRAGYAASFDNQLSLDVHSGRHADDQVGTDLGGAGRVREVQVDVPGARREIGLRRSRPKIVSVRISYKVIIVYQCIPSRPLSPSPVIANLTNPMIVSIHQFHLSR